MTPFLVSISIGPVQEFIAAARKTADLYAGSELLVKIVQAAAGTFPEGSLIFPADKNSQGANKILAQIDGDPAEQVKQARSAAAQALNDHWADAWKKLSPQQQALIDQQRAKVQLDSLLEFYAAWVPINGDYPAARTRVERLLAGRKALRDFAPTVQNDAGIFKSPLDPSQASVLTGWDDALETAPLKLKKSESLDAVSLLKRISGTDLRDIHSTHTLAERALNPDANLDNIDEDKRQPRYPYFAILVADGDSMGKLISGMDDAEQHRHFSGQLDDFATEAKQLIEAEQLVEDARGQMVYAGGDDVLALLPVTTAVKCAEALAKAFNHTARGTLSAGIAIVHYREPLSVSLAYARAAEKAAKDGGRNCLSIALHTRGGAPMTVTRRWDDVKALEQWQEANAKGQVTRGFPYELRELAREWPVLDSGEEFEMELLNAEAERILGRKQAREGKGQTPSLPDFSSRQDLTHFADLLILARFLSGQALTDAPEVAHA